MKKRMGFVSNSSSSSFVAVGFNLAGKGKPKPTDEMLIKLLGIDVEKKWQERIKKIQIKVNTNEDPDYWNQERVDKEIADGREAWLEDWSDSLIYLYFENKGFDILQDGEDGVDDDDYIIAEMISVIKDDNFEPKAIPFSELEDRFSKLKELMKKIAPNTELTFYTGTRLC